MRLLMVTTVLPGALGSGGEVASQAFADGLRALGHDLVVIGYRRPGQWPPMHADDLAVGERPIETAGAPVHAAVWMTQAVLTRRPYSMAKYVSRSYGATVRRQLRRVRPDLVLIDHAQMAWAAPDAPHVYLAHNVEHELYGGLARGPGWRARASRREAVAMRRVESRLCDEACAVWTLTADDADTFRSMNARALAFDVPVEAPPPPEQAAFDVGLLGTWTWRANAAGLEWFLRDVHPRLPDGVSVEIAGAGSLDVTGDSAKVRARGRVPDAAAFLQSARAIAVPSVAGGGLQMKTLDAIASGRPVVATPVAMRGITDPPSTVTIAADASSFADGLRQALCTTAPEDAAGAARSWVRERTVRFRGQLSAALADVG